MVCHDQLHVVWCVLASLHTVWCVLASLHNMGHGVSGPAYTWYDVSWLAHIWDMASVCWPAYIWGIVCPDQPTCRAWCVLVSLHMGHDEPHLQTSYSQFQFFLVRVYVPISNLIRKKISVPYRMACSFTSHVNELQCQINATKSCTLGFGGSFKEGMHFRSSSNTKTGPHVGLMSHLTALIMTEFNVYSV